jgi:XTP/dITP diphosphohydrolase
MLILTLATTNEHKAGEVRSFLVESDITVVSRPEACPNVVESGDTFEANALLKANAVARWTGGYALSDDSGLEVEALDGAPGVWSARFAGEGATDAMNRERLLSLLDEEVHREARFRCVLALCDRDGRFVTFSGEVGGRITHEELGESGFGYDSIFVPHDGDGRTFAQMSIEEKSELSHRGRALQSLHRFVLREQWWGELTLPS